MTTAAHPGARASGRYDVRPMRGAMSILESTRLYLLAFTLPYAAAWADGDGKTLLTIAFSLLVIFHGTSLDTRAILESARPRLGLTRDRDLWNPPLIDRTRSIVAALLALVTVLLLFVSFRGAVAVALAAGIMLAFSAWNPPRAGRVRMMFAEILWPGFMLIVPMILFSWILREDADAPVVGQAATGVGALMLAGYVLLCEIRDAALDAGKGRHTLATVLGRNLCTMVLFLVLAALLITTTRGVGLGLWPWWAPAIAGIAALVTLWSVAADAIDGVPPLWTAAALVIALGVV
jgi:hypothetical protein